MDDDGSTVRESEPTAHHQRGEPRDSTFLQATIRLPDDTPPMIVRVRNLSAGGMMADCAVPFEPGHPIEIELRNIGAVGGHVAWADGQRIGVAFDVRVDPQQVRKPNGRLAGEAMLVKRPSAKPRRPGLRIE